MQPPDFAPLRFSTAALPERDRVAAWRDFFGPKVFGGEVEPVSDLPFSSDLTVRLLPGLSLVSAVNSPTRFSRTSALLADGRDDFGLHINFFGCTVFQRGREITCGRGDAVLVSVAEAGTTVAPSTSRFFCMNISRAALAPLVADPDDAVLRSVPPETEALRYMLSYVRFLEEQVSFDTRLAETTAIHLRDLLALMLGATRDAAFIAERGGLRAARLQAIRRFIADNLGQPGLTVDAAAARHRLTPRSVQRLFEEEGTTFSESVLNQRLAAARRMLSDPRHADWTVSAVALEAGFGDISYFNRCFRRKFGETPTGLRGRMADGHLLNR